MAFTVKEAARVEWADANDGIVSVSFKAGAANPKSEREEQALAILVNSGLAEETHDAE